MSSSYPDLILHNACIITLDERRPAVSLVAARDGRISLVASNIEMDSVRGPNTLVIDCQGQTLVPGFIDAHCHVFAYASSLLAVDCGPSAAASIEEIEQAINKRARETAPGQWIRAGGYDEFSLRERRHPTRYDLDKAAPHHPVRLNHRSGHACVLNSAALRIAGIFTDTPDPVGGVIERDWETGEPNGILLEMNDYLDGLIPPLSEDELRLGIRLASERMTRRGITSVHDATSGNSIERWRAFAAIKKEGAFAPRITAMVGAKHVGAFVEQGLRFSYGGDSLNVGHAKIMLTMTTGAPNLGYDELLQTILRAHRQNFPVVIHAVEAEAVELAALALIAARGHSSSSRDRIEHCSECPPHALDRLLESGAAVVTQPVFLYHSGERYLSEVREDMRPWLYRIGSWQRAGIAVAASSDAPVAEPNPLLGIYAAVTRRARSGDVVNEAERVSIEQALRMHTLAGAYAASQESTKGSIAVGKLADFALLDADPTRAEPEQLKDIKVTLTVIGGEVVWQA